MTSEETYTALNDRISGEKARIWAAIERLEALNETRKEENRQLMSLLTDLTTRVHLNANTTSAGFRAIGLKINP